MSALYPRLSVVIAARDASATLGDCLGAVCSQATEDIEIIVVDDCSSDSTASIAGSFPVHLIRFPSHRGVAAARNAGAEAARGQVLLFLDADVVASRDLFENGLLILAATGADAVIGSYDDNPAAQSTVSQFKNLAHHYFHQSSPGPTATFWGACGFVKRELFRQAGGFDQKRYVAPSMEDVEFGSRLARRGAVIRIEPDLQVTHLKRWTLASMLHADIMRRAVPWTIIAMESGSLPSNLNLSATQRIAAVTALGEVVAAAAFLSGFKPGLVIVLSLLIVAAALNRRLFGLFYRRGGFRLLAAGFFLQQFYYLYSLFGLGIGLVVWTLRRRAPAATGTVAPHP